MCIFFCSYGSIKTSLNFQRYYCPDDLGELSISTRQNSAAVILQKYFKIGHIRVDEPQTPGALVVQYDTTRRGSVFQDKIAHNSLALRQKRILRPRVFGRINWVLEPAL